MSEGLTDLETLADRMRLPTGGIAIIVWGNQLPQLLVRARGGFTMDHIPLKVAFDDGLVECSVAPAVASAATVARAPLPNQDVLMEGRTLQGVDTLAVAIGSQCTLLEVKAMVAGNWKTVGRRLLNASHDMSRRLADQLRVKPQCEVNLLQGPRPQFVASCVASLEPDTLTPGIRA